MFCLGSCGNNRAGLIPLGIFPNHFSVSVLIVSISKFPAIQRIALLMFLQVTRVHIEPESLPDRIKK
jgi:hypothetical protein